MKLYKLIGKNVTRNRRRTVLTVVSMAFSILLLSMMMTIYRSFYLDKGSIDSSERLIVRDRVSLVFPMPISYRERIRSINGVQDVVNATFFGGQYKDSRPENMFVQFATDPDHFFDVYADYRIAANQLEAWKRDRTGCVADSQLAMKHGWKIGDRILLTGTIFPGELTLTLRGIYTAAQATESVYFNSTYFEEAFPQMKGQVGFYAVRAESPTSVAVLARAIDDTFRNSPTSVKAESEKDFQLDWVNMLGNVKGFILSICAAVVFATCLVSANTMAMSIRERSREVAIMKTLGFTNGSMLVLLMAEAIAIATMAGLLGVLGTTGLLVGMARMPGMSLYLGGMKMELLTAVVALLVASCVGFLGSVIPAYNASRVSIVDGLRHIG